MTTPFNPGDKLTIGYGKTYHLARNSEKTWCGKPLITEGSYGDVASPYGDGDRFMWRKDACQACEKAQTYEVRVPNKKDWLFKDLNVGDQIVIYDGRGRAHSNAVPVLEVGPKVFKAAIPSPDNYVAEFMRDNGRRAAKYASYEAVTAKPADDAAWTDVALTRNCEAIATGDWRADPRKATLAALLLEQNPLDDARYDEIFRVLFP